MDVSLCRHETPGGRDEIYVGRYSHFARSCFFFTCWAYGFGDMIEYERMPPYIKVSSCCVNMLHIVANIYVPIYVREWIEEERNWWQSISDKPQEFGRCFLLLNKGIYMHFFFLPKPENISCKVPKKGRRQQLSVWMFWATLTSVSTSELCL